MICTICGVQGDLDSLDPKEWVGHCCSTHLAPICLACYRWINPQGDTCRIDWGGAFQPTEQDCVAGLRQMLDELGEAA